MVFLRLTSCQAQAALVQFDAASVKNRLGLYFPTVAGQKALPGHF